MRPKPALQYLLEEAVLHNLVLPLADIDRECLRSTCCQLR